MNQPYVKQYSEDGVLLNPITKEQPYLSKLFLGYQKINKDGVEIDDFSQPVFQPNRRERHFKQKPFNNRKRTKGRLKFN
jgi:hypothetical protein